MASPDKTPEKPISKFSLFQLSVSKTPAKALTSLQYIHETVDDLKEKTKKCKPILQEIQSASRVKIDLNHALNQIFKQNLNTLNYSEDESAPLFFMSSFEENFDPKIYEHLPKFLSAIKHTTYINYNQKDVSKSTAFQTRELKISKKYDGLNPATLSEAEIQGIFSERKEFERITGQSFNFDHIDSAEKLAQAKDFKISKTDLFKFELDSFQQEKVARDVSDKLFGGNSKIFKKDWKFKNIIEKYAKNPTENSSGISSQSRNVNSTHQIITNAQEILLTKQIVAKCYADSKFSGEKRGHLDNEEEMARVFAKNYNEYYRAKNEIDFEHDAHW